MVRLLGQGTLAAIARERAINNLGINFASHLVINAQLLEYAGAIAFYHYISSAYQLQKLLPTQLTFQIKGYALFIAVQLQMPIAKILKKGRKGAGVITQLRLLDFDDLRPKIGQQHGAIRSRQKPRQI